MFEVFSLFVQIFFLLNVNVVSFTPFFTLTCKSTLTSALAKPVHVNMTENVWGVVGIVPNDDMFNFGVFKASESEDSTEIVYGS